jgi:serine/threonine protein kinase
VAVDTLLDNRFAIDDAGVVPLGQGGMAVIYSGTDTESDQPIAAKTLLPDYQGDSHRRARFRREAEVLKAVQHPYVVNLIDIVDGRRGSWILMEQLEGETLRDKLDNEGPFSPKTVSRWLAQVCAALEHMHQLGYVHLDITPQNLFLKDDGDIKLIDFGIAQKAFSLPRREGNKLLGTAAYISPEHGSGRIVTPSSDIYSLGCVVFELLTGKRVFTEHGQLANDATITMRQDSVPDLPSSVAPELNLPLWVDTVIAKALLPNPEDRYPSMSAFAEGFNAHANPPFLRLPWPNRKKQAISTTELTSPQAAYEATIARPVRVQAPRAPREPSRAVRWLRKELRNARRAMLVFALLISVVFAAPLLGGSVAFDWLLGVVPGSTSEVVAGNWYLRAGPTTDSEIRTLMEQGQSVRVSGSPTINGNQMWWPVSTEADGTRIHGWAHDAALDRTWLMDRAAGFEQMRDRMGDRWDSVWGWLPG